MPFALHEYDVEFSAFVSQAIRELAIAQRPLLEGIAIETTRSSLSSIVRGDDSVAHALPASHNQIAGSHDTDAVRKGDLWELWITLDDLARQTADGFERALISTLRRATETTGNVVSVGDRPMFEVVREMFESYQWSLDENDELSMPSLIVNPSDVDKFPPLTDDQQEVLDEIKARKLKELRAARRVRRLS